MFLHGNGNEKLLLDSCTNGFSGCQDEIPYRMNVREERFILAHSLQRTQSIVTGKTPGVGA